MIVTTQGRRRRRRLPEAARPWLLLAPALLVVTLLFMGALLFGILQSLGFLPLVGEPEPSFDAYISIFNDPAFWESLWLSLRIAFLSTGISIVLAVGTALLIFRTERGRRSITFLYQFNLPIPHIVGGVAMLLLLSQSGLFSRLAFGLGLTESPSDFPALTNDRMGFAIIAEYVWKETVFIGVVVLAALAGGVAEYRGPGADPRRRTLEALLACHRAAHHAGRRLHVGHRLRVQLRRLRDPVPAWPAVPRGLARAGLQLLPRRRP